MTKRFDAVNYLHQGRCWNADRSIVLKMKCVYDISTKTWTFGFQIQGPKYLNQLSSSKVTLPAPNKVDKFFFFFLLKTIHISRQTTRVTLGNKLLNFSAAHVKVKEDKASNPQFAQVLENMHAMQGLYFGVNLISSISQWLFCIS